MGIKLNYKEVVDYFDSLSPDMSELVLDMIHDRLEAKAEKRAKVSANLKKARAARGSKTAETAADTNAANAAPVAHRRPGRPARVAEDVNQTLAAGSAGQ